MPIQQKIVIPPSKAISQSSKPLIAPKAPTPAKLSKVTYTGMKSLKGGMKVSHTGEVIDNSVDSSQFLPYIASCITCGWQSRIAEKDSAEMLIKGHVGL